MKDCQFCKIVEHNIPSTILYEDELMMAFDDINPKAPIHKLIIPKKHIASIDDLATGDTELVGYLIQNAKTLARELGVAKNGYRLVFNIHDQGGQEVPHLHLHLLAGRQMTWPPG